MSEPLEERVLALEQKLAEIGEQTKDVKSKDVWDKLSALSTLISGVIIASIGIWVNQSLTVGQQKAQDAQAEATRTMEKAHNDSADRQAAQAMELQKQQAADSLAFQKQQAADQRQLEQLRMNQQRQQAADTLAQQRDQNASAFKIQQAQLAKDFLPQLQGNERSRSAALKIMAEVDPKEALILSQTYSETVADPSLVQTSTTVIAALQKSSDPAISQAASSTSAKVTVARRIQGIVNVFESGKPHRNYAEVSDINSFLEYGGFILNGEALYQVVNKYCAAPDAKHADELKSYLDRIKSADKTLAKDSTLKQLLVSAGAEPVMQKIQDDDFEQRFWRPAQSRAAELNLSLPLSMAVLFDATFSEGTGRARVYEQDATNALGHTPQSLVEVKVWTKAFNKSRRDRSPQIFRTFLLKRIDYLNGLIQSGNWNLDPPLVVDGVTIQ